MPPLLVGSILLLRVMQSDPIGEHALARFHELDPVDRTEVVVSVLDTLRASDHELVRQAAELRAEPPFPTAAMPAPLERAFDADRYAPALGLETTLVRRGSPRWKRVVRDLLRGHEPPRNRWSWDPAQRRLLAPPAPPPEEEVLAALIAGSWPDDGFLDAVGFGLLDDDAHMARIGAYFDHLYRDRLGRVYEDVTLYDVWNSQRRFEVSDVEAIAFLREIEGDRRTVSPIPTSRHDEIYRRIEEAFVRWRAYRVLREGLARRWSTPHAAPTPTFAAVAERLDQAWVLTRHEPSRMRVRLGGTPERKAFLAAVNVEALTYLGMTNPPEWWTEGWRLRETQPGALRRDTLEVLRLFRLLR